jgi:hypothetical protein
MSRYVAEGRFIGKDQSLMAATCLETTLCLLLDGTSTAWFRKGEWPPFWFGLGADGGGRRDKLDIVIGEFGWPLQTCTV